MPIPIRAPKRARHTSQGNALGEAPPPIRAPKGLVSIFSICPQGLTLGFYLSRFQRFYRSETRKCYRNKSPPKSRRKAPSPKIRAAKGTLPEKAPEGSGAGRPLGSACRHGHTCALARTASALPLHDIATHAQHLFLLCARVVSALALLFMSRRRFFPSPQCSKSQ
jgi:hypothetical protein